MMRKTYTRAQWEEAQQQWDDGQFSDEWRAWRHEAAMAAGIVYPPAGSKWDQWDDDSPSQRAMLIRAIRETPAALHEAIAMTGKSDKPRSWSTVLTFLLAERDAMRQAADDEDRERRLKAAAANVPHDEAARALKSILQRIGDS